MNHIDPKSPRAPAVLKQRVEPAHCSGVQYRSLTSIDSIRDAARVLRHFANVTPLVPSSVYEASSIWLKCEHLQRTGSFKLRGAYYALNNLDLSKHKGVVTASSGNHAIALAYAAMHLNVPCTVVMPTHVPRVKLDRVRAYGARVFVEGITSLDREHRAKALANEHSLAYIPSSNHPDVIAAQATVALEMVEQNPNIEVTYVPVGGGGLLSGVASALRHLKPSAHIVAVEPEGAASMKASIEAGQPQTLANPSSMADGLLPARPGEHAFAHALALVDQFTTVSEVQIVEAIERLRTDAKMHCEPSGAVAFAAALEAKRQGDTRQAVVIVSGGNTA